MSRTRQRKKHPAPVIGITGTPGTGKSSLAKYLCKKFGWRRLDLHRYYQKISTGYNQKKQCYDISLQKLRKLVQDLSREDAGKADAQRAVPLVIDTHIIHHLSPAILDFCIVLTCSDLRKLRRRLERRGYGQAKIRENLDAEIFQVCLSEARERGHNLLVFDNISREQFPRIGRKIKKVISEVHF